MTISKELAQRLVDTGIVVESEKVWAEDYKQELYLADARGINKLDKIRRSRDKAVEKIKVISAPNSDELLTVLPSRIIYNVQVLQLEMYKEQNGYGYRYCKEGGDSVILSIHKSSSEALGLLALKLVEDGLLEEAR